MADRIVDSIPADKLPAAHQAREAVKRAQSNVEFSHLLGKARDAKLCGEGAWRCMSTGEKVAVALVLNRADWLKSMNYTIVEAIDRAGSQWVAMFPAVVRALEADHG